MKPSGLQLFSVCSLQCTQRFALGAPLIAGDLVVVSEADQAPRNGVVEELDSKSVLICMWMEGDNRFGNKFSGEKRRFKVDACDTVELERDHIIKSDNYKTIWGPHDVFFQSHKFGTRVLKRNKKIMVEAGMYIRVSPSCKDTSIVLGVILSVKGRKTTLDLVLFDPKRKLLNLLDFQLLEKIWDDKDRIREANPESANLAVQGRALMSITSNFDSTPSISPNDFLGTEPLTKGHPKSKCSDNYPTTAGL